MKVARFMTGTLRVLVGAPLFAVCWGGCADLLEDSERPSSVIQLELKKGCGDGVCGPNEHCRNCRVDCGPCSPTCGDGFCSSETEGCASCPADCGACPPACGDGTCDASETCASCFADCGGCPPECGDGSCNGCETCDSCAQDCGACGQCVLDADCVPDQACHPTRCTLKAQGSPSCRLVCDASCQPATLDCGQGSCACQSGRCVTAMNPVCGDGVCNGCEACDSCPADCGACGQCTVDADCAASPVCHPTTCTLSAQVSASCKLTCDGSCSPGTLDCGQGKCACQSGQCVANILPEL